MANLQCIGFDASTREVFLEQVGAALERSEQPATLGPAGDSYRWFRDASGAAMGARINAAGAVECVTPFFAPASPSRWRVRTSSPHIDRDCLHCSGADCDLLDANGEMQTRSTVQWLFFQPYHDGLKSPVEQTVDVVGFASSLTLCRDQAEFDRAGTAAAFGQQNDEGPRIASEAFLPFGMFGNEGNLSLRAQAIVTGSIEFLDRQQNTVTGSYFRHLRLRTMADLKLDVVAADAAWPEERPALAIATVWLVGRPTDAPIPTPPRKSWWQRMIGSS